MRKEKYLSRNDYSCQVCQLKPVHLLIVCLVFKVKTHRDRHLILRELNSCYICFSEHRVSQCSKTRSCLECGGRQHLLLHLRTTEIEEESTAVSTMYSSDDVRPDEFCVFLSIVSIFVQEINGYYLEVQTLINVANKKLHDWSLPKETRYTRTKCNLVTQEMAEVPVSSDKSRFKINRGPARNRTPQLQINVYVVPRISGLLPAKRVRKSK